MYVYQRQRWRDTGFERVLPFVCSLKTKGVTVTDDRAKPTAEAQEGRQSNRRAARGWGCSCGKRMTRDSNACMLCL